MGLFLRLRLKIPIICDISLSLPNTGSILPSRALAVISVVNRSKASGLKIVFRSGEALFFSENIALVESVEIAFSSDEIFLPFW